MTLAEFSAAIKELNIPARYGYFKESQAVPYIAYTATENNTFHADGVVVYSEPGVELNLYTKSRDIAAESTVEQFLTTNGIAFDVPDLFFDEDQNIHTATYNFSL